MKDTSKGQQRLSPIITKRATKSSQKTHLPIKTSVAYEKPLEITRRTRNVRNQLQQIRKQFDNHAITKFFQRAIKTNHNIDYDVSMDENACDGFSGESGSRASSPDQLIDVVGIDDDDDDDEDDDEEADIYMANNQCQRNDSIDDNERSSGCNVHAASTNDHRNSIQTTNIFLQKPVLHLDIDKQSLNQAASIVINKHSQPFASAFQPFNATIESNNGQTHTARHHDQRQASTDHSDLNASDRSDAGSVEQTPEQTTKKVRKPRKCSKRRSDSDLYHSDSNSCDSGVVSDKSFEFGVDDQNKPTTPHRIVCTSNTPTNAKEVRSQQTPQTGCNGIGGIGKRTRGRPTRNW